LKFAEELSEKIRELLGVSLQHKIRNYLMGNRVYKPFQGIVEILEETPVFEGFFKLIGAKFRFQHFNEETMMEPPLQLKLERGDSVAVLVHNVTHGTLILIEQFRYATYRNGDGWILEVVAGKIEKGENPEDAARRETMEEVGFNVTALQHVHTSYVSPGGTSERIILYYAQVRPEAELGGGGGVQSETEVIRRYGLPIDEALELLEERQIKDGKTIIALQWLENQLLKGNLQQIIPLTNEPQRH
jgi:nudix-type nucleoside diphosphatase (YffH/AdpP family)